MGSSLSLGTIFGVHVRLDGTLLLLFVIFGFEGFDNGGFYGAVNMLVFLVFLLVSIILHEVGHAVAGILFGLRPVEIALQFFGGYTRYAEAPRNPLEEAVVSLAGPTVNLALAALLYLILARSGGGFSGPTAQLLDNLRYANLILGILNLLPAFPLDGGSFTRAILSLWLSRALARLIVASLGVLLGAALVVYGFAFGIMTFTIILGILLLLIAWREVTAAREEM